MQTPEHILVGPDYKEHKWYGRVRVYDKRSKEPKHRMRAAPVGDRWFRNHLDLVLLDQGATSECVAYGTHTFLHTHPVINKPWNTPREFYDICQDSDEWAGAEPEYYGTSVNSAMRQLRDAGAIDRWVWTDEASALARHIINDCPACIGVDWTSGMDWTDEHGYIHPTGEVLGGHFLTIKGVNLRKRNPDGTTGAFRGKNTWGKWGHNNTGRCWITFDDMQKLLDGLEGWPGEAAAPHEIKRIA